MQERNLQVKILCCFEFLFTLTKLHLSVFSLVPIWFVPNRAALWPALRFWARLLLTVIMPFIVLAYFNANIVRQLRRKFRRMATRNLSAKTPLCPEGDRLPGSQQKAPENGGQMTSKHEKANSVGNKSSGRRSKNSMIKHLNINRLRILKLESQIQRKDVQTRHSLLRQEHKNEQTIMTSCVCEESNTSATECIRNETFEAYIKNNYGVRVATRTLLMVVGCYLISNSLATVLQIWEFFDIEFLRKEHKYAYLVASDIAALVGLKTFNNQSSFDRNQIFGVKQFALILSQIFLVSNPGLCTTFANLCDQRSSHSKGNVPCGVAPIPQLAPFLAF